MASRSPQTSPKPLTVAKEPSFSFYPSWEEISFGWLFPMQQNILNSRLVFSSLVSAGQHNHSPREVGKREREWALVVSCCGHMEKKVLNIPKGKENHIPHCICFALRQDYSPTSPTATSIADTQGCPSPVLCPASFLHNTCPEGAGTSKGRSLIPTAFTTSHHTALSQHGGQRCRFADTHFQSLVVTRLWVPDGPSEPQLTH